MASSSIPGPRSSRAALPNLNPAHVGERVAAGRRARGLSQDEVARHLGVSRPTVVAMEKGTRPLRAAELALLADLFGCTVHELVAQRQFLADFAPQFRLTQAAKISPEALEAARSEFQRVCEDYVTLEELLGAPMPRFPYPDPYGVDRLSAAAAAEEVASLERSRLNLGQGPIHDLTGVLELEVGLRVFALPLAEFRIAGMFRYTERVGGCILVNGNHPPTRQVWSAAHEFGHFLTDRYSGEITVLVDYARKPRSEQFADCFAASFLMPAAGLRQRFRAVLKSRDDFTVADLCWIASRYGVSVEAMTRRLEGLGCLQRGMWDRLSGDGFKPGESQHRLRLSTQPVPTTRLPERYRRLAVQAFEDEKITESELLRFLRCSRVEAREAVESMTQSREMDDRTGIAYQLSLEFAEPLDVAAAERE